MLTLRMLHLSRAAMPSTFTLGSAISSSSHRRPRAIDATKVARVSDLIGRARCGGIPTGRGGFAVWAQGRHQGSGLGDAPQVRDR